MFYAKILGVSSCSDDTHMGWELKLAQSSGCGSRFPAFARGATIRPNRGVSTYIIYKIEVHIAKPVRASKYCPLSVHEVSWHHKLLGSDRERGTSSE